MTLTLLLVGANDSAYLESGGLRGRGRPLHIGVENVQVFQAGAGVEQNYCVFGVEKAIRAELAVGNQAGCAFGSSEDSFMLRPMASGFYDFLIGRAYGRSIALF